MDVWETCVWVKLPRKIMKELDTGPTEIFWRTNWNIYQKPSGERVTGKEDGKQIARGKEHFKNSKPCIAGIKTNINKK